MTRQVSLKSLNDPIDATTPQGRLIFNLFASLAEFEREVMRERTQAGLAAARARGRTGGRPKGLPRKAEATGRLQVVTSRHKLAQSSAFGIRRDGHSGKRIRTRRAATA
jgi:DNA invertase Pin-like site-specific DNA recombinase